MFCKVMTLEPELCKHLLELILNVKIRDIHFIESQRSIDAAVDSRGIRLDVYLEDEANTVYDIEMQNAKQQDLPKRSRYYQSMLDINLLERGISFKQLRKSFVIFICTFDPFGEGLPVYCFENICDEDPQLRLNDETYKIFVNATAWSHTQPSELRSLLQYINNGIITDEYTQNIEQSVYKIKTRGKWRSEYMTFEMKLREVKEDAYEEGRAEGFELGKLKILSDLINNRLLTLADAAKQMNMSEAELKKIITSN